MSNSKVSNKILAAQRIFYNACKTNDLETVKLALGLGATMDGLSLGLAGSFSKENIDVFNWLLENNCPVDQKTWTCLVYNAVTTGIELEIIKLKCTLIWKKGHSVESAIFWALYENNFNLYEYLLRLKR